MKDNSSNTGDKISAVDPVFVIVHAAWQGPYAWRTVNEILLNQGYEVQLVELPGHGIDHTEPATIDMNTYVEFVASTVLAMGKKVILAGHSLAGMIISGVAERIPDAIQKLVYIAAYIPQDGQSAYAISLSDQQSLLGASLVVSENGAEYDVKKESIVNIFSQDAPAEVAEMLLKNYRPEPAAPFADALTLSAANFGNVSKFYVETMQDHGIGNDLQRSMIDAAGVVKSYQMNTGHSPSLSKPEELAQILVEISQE